MYWYKDKLYPNYLKEGNQCQYVLPIAKKFCQGRGIDIGCGGWPFPGATGIDKEDDVYNIHLYQVLDYVFSSHCLEHIENPIMALAHWKDLLKPGGILFLYLPHPDMEYWLPQNCRKHLHSWYPVEMAKIVTDIGFHDVIHSERDLAWGFSVVGHA